MAKSSVMNRIDDVGFKPQHPHLMSYQPISEKTTFKGQSSGYCGINGSGKVATANLPLMVPAGVGHQGGIVPAPTSDPGANADLYFLNQGGTYTDSSGFDLTNSYGSESRVKTYNEDRTMSDFFLVDSPADFSVRVYAVITGSPQPDQSVIITVSMYELDGVTYRQTSFTLPTDNIGDSVSGVVYLSNPYNHNIFISANFSDFAGPAPFWTVTFILEYL